MRPLSRCSRLILYTSQSPKHNQPRDAFRDILFYMYFAPTLEGSKGIPSFRNNKNMVSIFPEGKNAEEGERRQLEENEQKEMKKVGEIKKLCEQREQMRKETTKTWE